MRRDRWNTFAINGYTNCIVGGSQASAGGVILHQIKLGKEGWMERKEQSNGRHSSFGPVTPVLAAYGEAKFEQARER